MRSTIIYLLVKITVQMIKCFNQPRKKNEVTTNTTNANDKELWQLEKVCIIIMYV